MILLDSLASTPWLESLGWTLLNFIWQGLATGMVYALVKRCLRGRSAESRYVLAMVTLAVLAVLPAATFFVLVGAGASARPLAGPVSASVTAAAMSISADAAFPITTLMEQCRLLLDTLVPWLIPLWLVGVACMALRVNRAWRHVLRLRATADFVASDDWTAVVQALCARLHVRAHVRVAASHRVTVPSVIGWLQPVVLIPVATITGLTPAQIELILVHELTHVRRQDYLWNLLQTMVETLLFYHPVVRWVARDARQEREHCCDDAVLANGGGAIDYARALTELECSRHSFAGLLVGAAGGQLAVRVQRLIDRPAASRPLPLWLPVLLAAILLGGVGLSHYVDRVPELPVTSSTPDVVAKRVSQPRVLLERTRLQSNRVLSGSLSLRRPRPIVTYAMLPRTTSPLPALPAIEKTPTAVTPVPPAIPRATQTSGLQAGASLRVELSRMPIYPAFARERGVTGSATLEFTLNAAGAVRDAHVTRVTGSRLFAPAALHALLRWKFTGADMVAAGTARVLSITFLFQLNGTSAGNPACRMPLGYRVCVN